MKRGMILFFLILFLSPFSVFAANTSINGDCKEMDGELECKLYLNTTRQNVKAISYLYHDLDVVSFTPSNRWDLDESRNEGVLLVTKQSLEKGKILIGTLLFNQEDIKDSISVREMSLSYTCKDTYCDDEIGNMEIPLTIAGEKVEKSNNYLFYYLGGGIFLFIIIFIIIIKKSKKSS